MTENTLLNRAKARRIIHRLGLHISPGTLSFLDKFIEKILLGSGEVTARDKRTVVKPGDLKSPTVQLTFGKPEESDKLKRIRKVLDKDDEHYVTS